MSDKPSGFVIDNISVIAEITDGEVTNYIRGVSGIIYSMDPQGHDWFYVTNNHGDITEILDGYGECSIWHSYVYDEYGNIVSSTGNFTNDENPFKYCGEYYDSESDLIYLRARYYSPKLGRFISEDPARDDLNWYVYCGSNPINFWDPLGLYDREAAVAYALKWGKKTNSAEYERFDTKELSFIVRGIVELINRLPGVSYYGGDCANFVSQCLVAGELKMNSYWHYYVKTKEEWHSNNSITYSERDMTAVWSHAKSQFQFFSSDWAGYKNGEVLQIWSQEGLQYNVKYSNIQPGDLMYFASRESGEVTHATIITKVENGEIYYAAHTSDYTIEPLSKKLDTKMVYIVRIRDDAERGYVQ